MKGTAKVQQTIRTTSINIPKDIVIKLNITKGEILLLEVQKDGSILIKR